MEDREEILNPLAGSILMSQYRMRTVGLNAGSCVSKKLSLSGEHWHYGMEDREEILNPLAGSSLRQSYDWQAICRGSGWKTNMDFQPVHFYIFKISSLRI
jgi:hypothetical protein